MNRASLILPHPADAFVSTQPLGALYTPLQTTFRVWAPTASEIKLHLYQAPAGGKANVIELFRHPDGAWDTTISGDLRGCYYTYTAAGADPRFNPQRELLDPYAQAVTGYDGRAIVVCDKTPVADRPTFPISEAVIYEAHLRDFTIDPDSGVQRRGKYLGLTETGTHLTQRPDIKTGLAHLLELGVNVVQLLPIGECHNDKANDLYGWGYDAVHHFSPDGWYATERFDARRVREVKQMIDALHRHGLRVTLDVVFNHTFESIPKNRVYSFEGLVPGYYYRLKHDGSYWDGSGTGNEFRSEAPMARRYILDCLKHWVTDYKVDGFRFDLLGLIDRETIEMMVAELRALEPQLLIYGEPWAGGTTPIEVVHKGAQRGKGWAVFNDHFRDALKGNVFNARVGGFVQAGVNLPGVKRGLAGAIDDFTDSPLETINYVECHDNHTLWDRLYISTADQADVTEADRRAMDKLAAVLILTAQGIPFLHAGQEFLRSKGGNHNSYNQPDAVNMIRWQEKAENRDIFDYYRGLIGLRRAHPLLRQENINELRKSLKYFDENLHLPVPEGCLAFQLEDTAGRDEWSRMLMLVNPQPQIQAFIIPVGAWQVYADAHRSAVIPFDQYETTSEIRVPPRSALLLGERHQKVNP
ncbi:MAG: type I pullulanase [Acidobacteria bacterium]|nr:type I pullulanase [Acidobacteriota bacterium]